MTPDFLTRACCCKAMKHGLDFCPACGTSLYESKAQELKQIKLAFEQNVK